MDSRSPQGLNLWRHAYAGVSFAVTILVGVYAGVWADRHWGTDPWGVVVGAVVGSVFGFYNLVKEFKANAGE